uniref:Uncharacterized protein n=1 Tax=Candidatus Kentrum sp. MB TaxID=2138164 RepID=A0A450XLD4_9GAMM|nr:MAG: hypothetical protein BECKMB1821I_GA0114274_101357 [Candidatus Kentron sp. MB]VFK75061.1 MAG: hypothetical protein BECKMB1821H_GA0114242_101457 [Candidatus Kentron sp. MB]
MCVCQKATLIDITLGIKVSTLAMFMPVFKISNILVAVRQLKSARAVHRAIFPSATINDTRAVVICPFSMGFVPYITTIFGNHDDTIQD